jgi:uncharacterized protein YggE
MMEPNKLVLISCIAVCVISAPATGQTAADVPVIVASGEGVVKATPDRVWVRIGAETRSKTSKDAQQRNAEAMTAVQQKIASFGIPKDAITTVGVDLQLEFDYRDGKQTPRGYVARNTIEVRVDELARVGDVLDAAVASGATTIHGLRFDVKAREAIEQDALKAAVGSAMARANAMASGAKRAVDRILRIEETFTGGGGPPQPMLERAAMMRMADTPTPIEAGEIEIRAQVRLTVAIK